MPDLVGLQQETMDWQHLDLCPFSAIVNHFVLAAFALAGRFMDVSHGIGLTICGVLVNAVASKVKNFVGSAEDPLQMVAPGLFANRYDWARHLEVCRQACGIDTSSGEDVESCYRAPAVFPFVPI